MISDASVYYAPLRICSAFRVPGKFNDSIDFGALHSPRGVPTEPESIFNKTDQDRRKFSFIFFTRATPPWTTFRCVLRMP
jgi:hypothetical protein